MPIWVCRTGSYGQHENLFLENNCICLTREGFDFDLVKCEKSDIESRILELNPDAARQTISNTWSQINIFAEKMAIGDVVILPKKSSSKINVAIIQGDYVYDKEQQFPLNHKRTIKVLAKDVDTTTFNQSLRYSLGAFRTVFQVRQEEQLLAELRKARVCIDEV